MTWEAVYVEGNELKKRIVRATSEHAARIKAQVFTGARDFIVIPVEARKEYA